MNNRIAKIIFFANGNTAAFDDRGEQIPALQESWLKLYLKFLEEQGYDVLACEFMLPTLTTRAKPFKTPEGGWNWTVEH